MQRVGRVLMWRIVSKGPAVNNLCASVRMPLQVGTRFGPYESLSAIGAGGPASARLIAFEFQRGLAVAQKRPQS
jgi:hypothetical protein